MIGDRITVEVVAIGAGRVKLGFTAPGDVEILREELAVRVAARRHGAGEQR